jgi:hypothetical protein
MINTKQAPRHIASLIRATMLPTIIYLQTIGIFWTTWAEVYRRPPSAE